MNLFDQRVCATRGQLLKAGHITIVQANLGLKCNLQCRHCHVAASPQRDETMSWHTMTAVTRLAAALPGCLVDLTGGAPELHPDFRRFIELLLESGANVQVRTNLTVLDEPGLEELPKFLADRGVRLMASLPCYLERNVTGQRGAGVHARSVEVLRRLNVLGYGCCERLPLNLVYNPGGAFLPPEQLGLEADYRRAMLERHGVVFTRLLTITNMPMGRFLDDLQQHNKAGSYRQLLRDSFNPDTLDGLMCRHQVCVAWDGTLADCDFNLALGLGLVQGLPRRIEDLDPAQLHDRFIVTGEHCYACTAGSGSSCGGALVA